MKVMKRADWPTLMDGAQRSVLVLAPWIDDELIKELFSFLPPVDVRIVFPRSTLENEESKAARYALRGVLDTNFDTEIRISDEELPACLLIDDEELYYSETYAEQLPEGASDEGDALAYVRATWHNARPWE